MLELKKISKKYSIPGKNDIIALDNITMSFKYNKFYGITGHSGSGKSTLLQILGLADNFDSGIYMIDKVDSSTLSDKEKSSMRINKFGFVFQSFYLNPKISALENVVLPMIINKNIKNKEERIKRAKKLLKRFGLEDKYNSKINQLSGGEQQRVAIARALANDPDIILADEPTGNLDKKNEKQVFEIFRELVDKDNKTVIVVSHNEILKDFSDEVYEFSEGKIIGDNK